MKRFWKDQRGSSLVLVMISTSFLILLAGAVIMTTITNIRLKSSQKLTQENFYETDSILDTISAGIQNESSEASAKAYEKALGEYNASLTSSGVTMDEKYQQDFLQRMLRKLTGDDTITYNASVTEYQYLDSVLEGYLSSGQVQYYVEHETTGSGDPHGKMVLDGYALVLKDVTVTRAHSTAQSYETTLTTDIRIEVPEVSTEAHSEYLEYAVLADDQIVADNGGIAPEIKGNVYSGTVNRTSDESSKAGIVISGGASLKINAEEIITRGDVTVSNGSGLTIGKSASSEKNAELWTENIITSGKNPTGGNEVTINAATYVADDMEIGGKNDTVTLKGKYYGYNFDDDYSALPASSPGRVKLSETASYSSSISINGTKDRLNMTNLTELVLAGRTFISKKTNAGEVVDYGSALSNPDIELGESLAVKSAQLSYFVSAVKEGSTDGYVKIVTDMDQSKVNPPATIPGYGTYQQDEKTIPCYYFTTNGITYLFDYEAYENRIGIPESNGAKQFDVKKYIDTGVLDPAEPLKLYTRNDQSVSADTIRYFYLNFADSKAASEFFNLFYNQSQQQTVYDVVNKTYVDAIGIQLPSLSSASGYILSAGNIMYSDQSDQDADGKAKIKLDNTIMDPSDSYVSFVKQYSKLYMSKQLALVDDYEVATTSTKWRLYDDLDGNNSDGTLTKSGKQDQTNLFDTLVDRSKLTGTQVGSYAVKRDDGSSITCNYIVSSGDVEWPKDCTDQGYSGNAPCFILAAGNVKIDGSTFQGLVISGDNVEMMSSVKISSDAEAIEKLFEADKNASSPVFYNAMSKYFRKSVDATIGTDADQDDIDNVSYENWKKND